MITINDLKVGMKVKLRDDLEPDKMYGGIYYRDYMKASKIVEIKSTHITHENKIGHFALIGRTHCYTPEMVEYVVPEYVRYKEKFSVKTIYKVTRILEDCYTVYSRFNNYGSQNQIPIDEVEPIDIQKEIAIEIANRKMMDDAANVFEITRFEDIPEWTYCYLRDETQTINVDADLRCSDYVNLDKFNYNSELKHHHVNDLDIMRIETRSGKIIWQRPKEKVWKEIDYNGLFELTEPTTIKIDGKEVVYCLMNEDCNNCKFNNIGSHNTISGHELHHADKIEIEVEQ
jgi:uncharacterized protein (UPF0179 family)